ncbi:hypothetical protein AAES_131566 [Amazona aestiva]|uniref:Succinate dehydrogenase assembly factor 3 n=1 Tax=Amazona aestiva TaxID=12930 RepID=A0A0Q3M264_AMAAE|nr:hypothetical protein AAES_131566 [Amazona aestiva]
MPGSARRLYRRILLLHRALPAALRALGDRYVKEEFRKHKAAGPAEAQRFLREWEASARRPAGLALTGLASRAVGTWRGSEPGPRCRVPRSRRLSAPSPGRERRGGPRKAQALDPGQRESQAGL